MPEFADIPKAIPIEKKKKAASERYGCAAKLINNFDFEATVAFTMLHTLPCMFYKYEKDMHFM